ncbi:MAG: hypothetical protein IK115_13685 [Lachnospiraceae bacterium]|nr:hypothetical protein [Lachnospiraceae bacterium]
MTEAEYTYGSAARKRRAYSGAEIHPIREERRRAQRNVYFDPMAVLLFVASAAIMLVVVFQFIHLQTEVTQARKHYSALRSEYEDLKRSNDLYHERIVSKVDMNEVARIAEEELGMKLAEEGQIISYSGQIDDYVKQYTDVPSEE